MIPNQLEGSLSGQVLREHTGLATCKLVDSKALKSLRERPKQEEAYGMGSVIQVLDNQLFKEGGQAGDT